MSPQKDRFSQYPRRVRHSTAPRAARYEILPGHYAVHRRSADAAAPEDALYVLDDGAIAVFEGSPGEARGEVGPVYALGPGGTPAVPTGRVFVRFKEGTKAEDQRKEIKQAGYEIEEVPAYAPHSAWVRALSGEIDDALKGIEGLEKLPDVENVEPQMLTQSVKR